LLIAFDEGIFAELMNPSERIIVALDVESLEKAEPLIRALSPVVGFFKVGLELLTSVGAPQVVDFIHQRGGKIFFDGKFDDIPNTVAAASRAVAAMGVSFFDVHASCGAASLRAAAAEKKSSKLLVVTVLTSHDEQSALKTFGASSEEKVLSFAREAALCGADGIVCSPKELPALAADPGLKHLLKVTPGVRPEWADANDQKRVLTPAEAIRQGATHLVIGRPILRPPSAIGDPVRAAKRIAEEIASVLK